MQSWQSQNGGDGNNSWQQDYNFTTQNGQFDQTQAWSQPMPGQNQNAFARQLNPSDPSNNLFHDPNMLSSYQDGHATFDLNQQFSGQDVIDPAFNDLHPELYSQQNNKIDLGGSNMHHLGQVQGHTQGQTQSFSPQTFSNFDAQTQHGQQFRSNTPQYSQAQLLPQTSRQQSHTPTQQFSNIQPNFATQLRPSHTPPAQQQHQFRSGDTFGASQVNGHGAQYQQGHSSQMNFQQPSQYPQTNFDPAQFQQQTQQTFTPPPQQQQQQQQQQVDPSLVQHIPSQDGTPQPQSAPFESPVVSGETAKKRQRITKAATPTTFSPAPEALPQSVGSPIEQPGKKMEELDALVAPVATPEEVKLIQKFQKRGKAAQAKFPTVKGLPHLAQEGTIRLPAPKSYDKLAPLVAIPPRSKKPINPEAGVDLPSEIQGRFTSQYRPAFDRIGLDERRSEASTLLDDFDKSMKALGKRRPKYTEYPHSFKEQLKADEATKNKAEKKAKLAQGGERNKPIRPAQRPVDPIEAAAWDIIGIVHLDPNVQKSSSVVAQRVQQAGDLFIKLRSEVNKSKQELDKAIVEKKPDLDIDQLKKQHEISKEALHRAYDATIEHADDSVMDNLGGHQKLVLSLVNVLISSIKAGDFNGKLPKVVLELFTHFPMTKKIAETTNFDTVRKRFLDKGDDDMKELAREITQKIKKMKQAEESTGYQGTSSASRAKAAAKTVPASSKRGRDDEELSDGRTAKKVAVGAGSSSLSKKLAQPKLQLASASKSSAAKASSSIVGDRGRPAAKPAVTTRPESTPRTDSPDDQAKAGTKQSSVKADAAKIAPSKASGKPPAPSMGAAPSSSALSGIASLLDSINTKQQKTPPTAAKDSKESDTHETPEEKARRLRKEARRKLRVSWKPEAELVETRVFEKEDDEDEGRDSNMVRDAGDDKSEGMVLKQRGHIEEDDDDDEELASQPWTVPYPVDFSPLEDSAKAKNYISRGGAVGLASNEPERIRQHENDSLLAIYTSVDDIPFTPKSPGPESVTAAPNVVHVPSDGPKLQEVQTRWRDEQQMGADSAFYTATSRMGARSKASPSNNHLGQLQGVASQSQSAAQQSYGSPGMRGGDTNVPLVFGAAMAEEVLLWLRSDKAKRWLDPNPSHSDPARAYNYVDASMASIGAFIEPISKALADKPYPATRPPDWMAHDPERVREWWTGFVKEAAVRQKRAADEEPARIEAEAAAHRNAAPAAPAQDQATREWLTWYAQQPPEQQAAYAPYLAALQQMNGGQAYHAAQPPPAQPQPQHPDPQLAAIYSALGGQSTLSSGQYPAPLVPPPAEAGYDPYQHRADPSPIDHSSNRDWERDYDREHEGSHDRRHRERGFDTTDDDQHSRGNKDKNKAKKPGPSTIHKPPNASLIGTKPCTFWQQGKCARGDKCTFRHD